MDTEKENTEEVVLQEPEKVIKPAKKKEPAEKKEKPVNWGAEIDLDSKGAAKRLTDALHAQGINTPDDLLARSHLLDGLIRGALQITKAAIVDAARRLKSGE